MIESLLHDAARIVVLCAEAIALLLIAIGIVEAVVNIVRLTFAGQATGDRKRAVWLEFARWLVAALTFQLAADIVSTSLAPGWDEVGRLGAIAAIRTLLSYFLDHEVEHTRRALHGRSSMPGADAR